MKRPMLALFLLALLTLAACSPAAPTRSPEMGDARSAAQPSMVTDYGAPGLAAEEPAAQAMAATPAPQSAPAGKEGGSSSGELPPPTSPLAFSAPGSGMVIKDAELTLLVRDTSQAVGAVTAILTDSGGYIINSQTWYQDGYMYASLRLGVPSAGFEDVLNRLRRVGLQVLREAAVGQDVSDQYTDLQSRLTNLEATAARVREFLADAKTIEESLRINQQLSELDGQIEQIKGQMRYYEGRAAYSTVTVTLNPEYPTPTPTMTATPTATPTLTPTAWSPAQTFDDATDVLAKQGQTVTDVLIWGTIVLGPWLVLITLAALIVRGVAKKMKLVR